MQAKEKQQEYVLDKSEPSEQRREELNVSYGDNIAKQRDPYWHVHIQTLGELYWIIQQRNWTTEIDPQGRERPNFRFANFRFANFCEVNLERADLFHAHLDHTILHKANFHRVDLNSAHLDYADLTGARLEGVYMNEKTDLKGIKLDNLTKIKDIIWTDVSLSQVDWEQIRFFGDELEAHNLNSRDERAKAFRHAARAYSGLEIALRQQGLSIESSKFRLRQRQMERRAMRVKRQFAPYIGSWLLDLVAGYGERPNRIFITYLLVITTFSASFYSVTHLGMTITSRLSWDESLVLSVTSFHGRGFFPGYLSLSDWVARLGAIEAVIGLFLEIILIATFSKRFLSN